MATSNSYYLNFLRNKNEANIFAYLIRAAQNTEYNHVEISVESEAGKTFFSAVLPRSRMASEAEVLSHYTIIKRRKLNVVVSDSQALYILNKYLGKEYSVLQNVVIALKLSIHFLRNYFADSKLNLDQYLNCTEYCARFEEEACGRKFTSTEAVSLLDLDSDESGVLDA